MAKQRQRRRVMIFIFFGKLGNSRNSLGADTDLRRESSAVAATPVCSTHLNTVSFRCFDNPREGASRRNGVANNLRLPVRRNSHYSGAAGGGGASLYAEEKNWGSIVYSLNVWKFYLRILVSLSFTDERQRCPRKRPMAFSFSLDRNRYRGDRACCNVGRPPLVSNCFEISDECVRSALSPARFARG